MGLKRNLGREIMQLAGEKRLYDPREDTESLSFCEKLGERDDLFGEYSRTIVDYATISIMGMQGILDKVFFISNTIGKRNFNEILKVFISYCKNVESIFQIHPTVEKLRYLKTKLITEKLEKTALAELNFNTDK